MNALAQSIYQLVNHLTEAYPGFADGYTSFFRYLFPILSFFILAGAITSLFHFPKRPEAFAKIRLEDGTTFRLKHWECILGHSKSADISLPYETISKLHAVISCQEPNSFRITDLDSKCGTRVGEREVEGSAPLRFGDTFYLGETPLLFLPISRDEQKETEKKRRQIRPIPPWSILLLLTFLQLGLCIQFSITKNEKYAGYIIPTFLIFCLLMWGYFILMRCFQIIGFELEMIAFYLTTLSLAITTSSIPYSLPKQLVSIVLGILVFLALGFLLRDLQRVQKLRWIMAAFALGLMLLTLLLGQLRYGATNWIRLGPLSFQPSELAKLCYIFAGSATLDRLFRRRNLGLFMLLSFSVIVCLGLMSDFGTAAIFFITFLVIAFLRSGDFATLLLITGGAVTAGAMVLIAKPYIWTRFATWRHAWDYAGSGGYQQVRTMTGIASGGLFGVGAGNGYLQRVSASDTDLVFGMVCEELGLLTGCMAVLCILVLAAYAIRSCSMSRSSFYTIAACSATSMLVFQTALNVFGSVDLLPLTGVTFPFVSNGGSSMILSWGLLAFLKATDTRPRASFANALRRSKRSGERRKRKS